MMSHPRHSVWAVIWMLVLGGWIHAEEPPAQPVRTDAYGDPLPDGALARLGTVRFRNGDYCSAAALSPDGKTLAVGSRGDIIRLLDTATGREVRRFKAGEHFSITCLVFSPDGKTLLSTGHRGIVYLWDVATGKELSQFRGADHFAEHLVFSANGKVLASGNHGHGQKTLVHAWDAANGKSLGQFEVLQNFNVAVVLSPDGKTLVSWGQYHGRNPGGNGDQERNQTLQQWDIASGKELGRIRVASTHVAAAAFSPDGKTLATIAGDGSLQIWDTASGKELRRSGGPQRLGSVIAFAPDGRTVVAGGQEGTVEGWEVATGIALKLPKGPACPVTGLAFPADGRILAWGPAGNSVSLWDARTGKPISPAGGHQMQLMALTLYPDGKTLASQSADGKICLWDVATGREISPIVPEKDHGFHGFPERSMTFVLSPDGKYLATQDQQQGVRLWDAATGREIRKLNPAQGFVTSRVAFSPDSRTLAAGVVQYRGQRQEETFPKVYLWEVASGGVRREWTGHLGTVTTVAFGVDGKVLATGSADTTVLLWDLGSSLTESRQRPGHLTPKQLDDLWLDLADGDAPKAYQAIQTLAALPAEALPYLRQRLQPATGKAPDAAAIAKLMTELDDDAFDVREKATRELEQVGKAAEAALRKTLAGQPSSEVTRRVTQILAKLETPGPARELLRPVRALEVLERIGTPDAQQLVTTLAKGRADAPITLEAKATLGRMARKNVSIP